MRRRDPMRRLKLPMAAGAVVLAAAVASGCTATTTTTTAATAHSELSVAANERPGLDAPASTDVPVASGIDPLLTRQACTAAAISAGDSTRLFHNQMAVIEQAAADDDTAALIAAANLIQRSFVQLAKGLAVLSTKPLSPGVVEASGRRPVDDGDLLQHVRRVHGRHQHPADRSDHLVLTACA